MSAVQLLGMAQTLGIIAVLTVLVQLLWFRRRHTHLLKNRVRQRLEQRSELVSEVVPGRVAVGLGVANSVSWVCWFFLSL